MAGTKELAPGVEPFPGHTLTRWLGRGGWGEVWQARRPDGQNIAVKFLPCDNQHTAPQEIRALQSIRQLQHPNLIRIDQIWCWEGCVVIAMELADGSMLDLAGVYRSELESGIPPEHLCHFLGQAAAAIDFLNARQHMVDGLRVAVRHCDVKPSNLLLLQDEVKLADFSLAAQTTTPMWYHRRVGTLNYAAPEIFQGWLSDRTDQYALAVSYVELRTGKLPFKDTPSTFTRTYVRPEPDLSLLTNWERPIINKALQPVPQNRFTTCEEMFQKLKDSLRQRAAFEAANAKASPNPQNA